MRIEVLADESTVARQAAQWLAAEARAAVAARGRFLLAVSGGKTPWQMLRDLGQEQVPWPGVHLFQVDERIAPEGHADRNLTHLRESLLGKVALPPGQLYPMPVNEKDLEAGARDYARILAEQAGSPPVLDVVHLGMGPDGHTASLVPGDGVLEVMDHDVAITSGEYQGRRRMTLTYPLLNRARKILWLITGASKVAMLARLRAGDRTIPAGRVGAESALVLADEQAAGR